MQNKQPRYYWRGRPKYYDGKRLRWYAQPANEDFWHKYWAARVNPDYFEGARKVDITRDEVGKLLQAYLTKDGLYLEAGCGPGYWVAALLANGFKVEGIEYSRALVESVQRIEPELPVRYGDALVIDRPDNYYDGYLSFGVVEHRFQGPEPFLREAYRVTKPHGLVIISVPYCGLIRRTKARLGLYEQAVPELEFFQYGFSEDEFSDLCEQTGFKLKGLHRIYPQRLLIEELAGFRWLVSRRGALYWKKLASLLLSNRDGHMLLGICEKA